MKKMKFSIFALAVAVLTSCAQPVTGQAGNIVGNTADKEYTFNITEYKDKTKASVEVEGTQVLLTQLDKDGYKYHNLIGFALNQVDPGTDKTKPALNAHLGPVVVGSANNDNYKTTGDKGLMTTNAGNLDSITFKYPGTYVADKVTVYKDTEGGTKDVYYMKPNASLRKLGTAEVVVGDLKLISCKNSGQLQNMYGNEDDWKKPEAWELATKGCAVNSVNGTVKITGINTALTPPAAPAADSFIGCTKIGDVDKGTAPIVDYAGNKTGGVAATADLNATELCYMDRPS